MPRHLSIEISYVKDDVSQTKTVSIDYDDDEDPREVPFGLAMSVLTCLGGVVSDEMFDRVVAIIARTSLASERTTAAQEQAKQEARNAATRFLEIYDEHLHDLLRRREAEASGETGDDESPVSN